MNAKNKWINTYVILRKASALRKQPVQVTYPVSHFLGT